jgi:hypothetical protein
MSGRPCGGGEEEVAGSPFKSHRAYLISAYLGLFFVRRIWIGGPGGRGRVLLRVSRKVVKVAQNISQLSNKVNLFQELSFFFSRREQ